MPELNEYLAAYVPDSPNRDATTARAAAQPVWAPKEPGTMFDALAAVYDRAHADGQAGIYDNRYRQGTNQ